MVRAYRCIERGDCYDAICTHRRTPMFNVTSGFCQANSRRRHRTRHQHRQRRRGTGRRRRGQWSSEGHLLYSQPHYTDQKSATIADSSSWRAARRQQQTADDGCSAVRCGTASSCKEAAGIEGTISILVDFHIHCYVLESLQPAVWIEIKRLVVYLIHWCGHWA